MQPTVKPNYIIPKIEINWEILESRAFGKDTFTDLNFTACATKSGSLSLENFSFFSLSAPCFPDSTRRGNNWKRGHNDCFKMH